MRRVLAEREQRPVDVLRVSSRAQKTGVSGLCDTAILLLATRQRMSESGALPSINAKLSLPKHHIEQGLVY